MDFTFIIALGLFLLVLFLIFLYLRNKYGDQLTNFKVYFYLGVLFIILGIAIKYLVFSFLGFISMTVGLVNKKKWRDFEDWQNISSRKKKIKIVIVVLLTIIFLYLSITNFWLR
ncbi:MAG: DUF3040 domain-containing protein [Candidatus Cloacimonetes bacterium]|nr:DUF3040 domain-containing protein [Candidatus Cloacimonadota bacterium]MCF7814723.1 DUF3040 domain-containing protein [Candidatus Cloacimonadota bacterium]MCF7869136.1 DUF3040 domain-containing protein [Candidatus Cloacimonadota bacterium]MCF7884595.1 DUF3040 domain-containing protein [Candidatus Cloacimonadota bacterium]